MALRFRLLIQSKGFLHVAYLSMLASALFEHNAPQRPLHKGPRKISCPSAPPETAAELGCAFCADSVTAPLKEIAGFLQQHCVGICSKHEVDNEAKACTVTSKLVTAQASLHTACVCQACASLLDMLIMRVIPLTEQQITEQQMTSLCMCNTCYIELL